MSAVTKEDTVALRLRSCIQMVAKHDSCPFPENGEAEQELQG